MRVEEGVGVGGGGEAERGAVRERTSRRTNSGKSGEEDVNLYQESDVVHTNHESLHRPASNVALIIEVAELT